MERGTDQAPTRPARTTRGNLSARQWADLRQAARLARSEGVSLTWRPDGSILIMPPKPLNDSNHPAGNRQRGQQRQRAGHFMITVITT